MFHSPKHRSSHAGRILLITLTLLLGTATLFTFVGRYVSGQGNSCQLNCTTTVPGTASAGTAASFTASATSSGCASTPTYEWDFGDGSAHAAAANATHVYTAPGIYTWRMTARASTGVTTIDTVVGGYGEGVEVNQAPFTHPKAIARDPQGRGLYVYDQTARDGLLRFINTSAGSVTVAGKTIAPGTSRVLIDLPDAFGVTLIDSAAATGMTTSPDGNLLFVNQSDLRQAVVFNVSATTQSVFSVSLPPGNSLRLDNMFSSPGGLAVHPLTGAIYFISLNQILKAQSLAQPQVVAGNGAGTSWSDGFPGSTISALSLPLLSPRDLVFDSAGNLYISDSGHARVIKVDGSGMASLVKQFPFNPVNSSKPANPYPAGLAIRGGNLYVVNSVQQVVVQLTGIASPAIVAGTAYTACDYSINQCGDGGNVTGAQFGLPLEYSNSLLAPLAADANGLFLLDQAEKQRGRVRYLNLSSQPVTLAGTTIAPNTAATIAGNGAKEPFDGLATGAMLTDLSGVAADASGNLWIADTYRHTIRFANRGQSPVTLFAGTAAELTVQPGRIATVNRDIPPIPADNTLVSRAAFNTPQGLFVTSQGLFVIETKGGPTEAGKIGGTLRFINTSSAPVTFYSASSTPMTVQPGFVRVIAGAGQAANGIGNGSFATAARFYAPSDVAVNLLTGDIYIADVGNRAVRKINGQTGIVSSLNLPSSSYTGLGLDTNGRLYIADFGPVSPQFVSPGGKLLRETAAGSGSFVQMNSTAIIQPRDVAVDASGTAYVAQSRNGNAERTILSVAANGAVTTVAGSTSGFDGDGAAASTAKLALNPPDVNYRVLISQPEKATSNITLGAGGEIFFADSTNRRIRRIGTGEINCVKTGTITVTGSVSQPTLTQLSPTMAYVGHAFSLLVNGTNFTPASQIQWNGSPRLTTFISSTQMTAVIPATDLTAVGTAQVTVLNPAPAGVSNALPLSINLPLLPSVSELNPSVVTRTSPGFRLQVLGANFTPTSIVRFKGQPRASYFINSETLEADILASDLLIGGSASITVLQPDGSLSGAIPLTITCPGLSVNTSALPPAMFGVPYNGYLAGQGGTAPYVFSGIAIPPGLSVSSAGNVSGTPTGTGNFTFTVSMTDANGCTIAVSFVLSVSCSTLSILPSNPSLPAASPFIFYSQTFTVTAGVNLPFSISSGALPPNMSLSATGVLSGTPTVAGTYTFVVHAGNDNLCFGDRSYSLVVQGGTGGCGSSSIVQTSLPNGVVGSLYYAALPGRATVVCGALPPGVNIGVLGPQDHFLAGGPRQPGVFEFVLNISFNNGSSEFRAYKISISNCPPVQLYPIQLAETFTGALYEAVLNTYQGFSNQGVEPFTFSVITGSLPLGLTLKQVSPSSSALTGRPSTSGEFDFVIRAIDAYGCIFDRAYFLRIYPLTIKLGDPLVCLGPGRIIAVEATLTNIRGLVQPADFGARPDQNLFAVANSCTATVGNCTIDTAMNKVNWSGTLATDQTVTIRYNVQVGDTAPASANVCVTSTATVGFSLAGIITTCATVNCPAVGPGALAQTTSPVSDGKPGSILLYNIYTSSIDPTRQNTRISVTNTNPSLPAYVHLFFVDGASCSVSDSYLCLTANQTTSFLASDIDPGTTGYIVAVAVDRNGCPANFNYLIGESYVKFASGHAANLGAQAISAIAGGLPTCDNTSITAALNFDGVSYSPVPRVLSLDNLGSRADGNDTILVLNRIGGNLGVGASTLGTIFGLLYNDSENGLSFSVTGGCQLRNSLSNTFPRTTPRFENFIPAGRSGWLKVYSQSDIGIGGAAINFNAGAGTSAGAFIQGHNLHALSLTTAASYTIPVFPPGC